MELQQIPLPFMVAEFQYLLFFFGPEYMLFFFCRKSANFSGLLCPGVGQTGNARELTPATSTSQPQKQVSAESESKYKCLLSCSLGGIILWCLVDHFPEFSHVH